ncbi:ABC transporter substrate-binding protein [Compostimonas suwonensis]|uniref:Iron complex transport system substrate-binding protein n=1 Tax=Compostimonas suwonensis TaxID=1048394 RepID=A0A2M9BWP2_9MICO|nr:ABC transporter substrate-binding protein [Compostimonas suwonensis]PJJ62372.1 iron complex transport system substrate-binding protein [Compostimonas suwonensis]
MSHPAWHRPAVRVIASAFAALTVVTLSACSSTAEADDGGSAAATRTVDSVYGEIEVPVAPERVAAVSYDTPWQLMSLDVTPVAAQDYGRWISDFSAAQQEFVEGIPTIGSYGEINYEAIAATDPDLIIGEASELDEAAFDRLSDIAPTVVVGGDTRGDWSAITEDTAAAVGRSELWDEQKAEFEATRDRIKADYADVISGNEWIHFSLGDDASQFSIQQPTGATGNLVVNELGLEYGPGVPTDYADSGYGSYPLEQLGPIFDGVTVALTFANADGSPNQAVQAIEDNELFTRLSVAQNDHVFHLVTSVTDYTTATEWLNEVEEKVLAVL